MIEQVARAMFDALIAGDDAYALAQGDGPRAITLDGTFDLQDIAQAAIAAMREPTPAMCEAVAPFPEHLRAEHPDPADPWHRRMTAATLAEQAAAGSRYSRMIDAALAGEGSQGLGAMGVDETKGEKEVGSADEH